MFALYHGPHKKYFELKKSSPEFHSLTCKKQFEQKKNDYLHKKKFKLKKIKTLSFLLKLFGVSKIVLGFNDMLILQGRI